MLEIHDLTKNFGGVAAVKNVTTRFEKGRVSAIIGPNGAGKTTLFNLVAGFHKPTSGRIVFDGRDVAGLRPDQMAALGIARSFQTTHLTMFCSSCSTSGVPENNVISTESGDVRFRVETVATGLDVPWVICVAAK